MHEAELVDELVTIIGEQCDPDTIIEALGLESDELAHLLRGKIKGNLDKFSFVSEVRDYLYGDEDLSDTESEIAEYLHGTEYFIDDES